MKYNHVIKRITCPVGTGLAGYTRKPTSIGIYDDLYLQALLLEDQHKQRLLLFCADLIGFDAAFVNRMRRWITRQDASLTAASVIFSATHTHCGPATCRFIESVGKADDQYLRFLEQSIKDSVRELLDGPMKPGNLYCGVGRCNLAVNRRLPVVAKATSGAGGEGESGGSDFVMRPNRKGPVDRFLAVMQIRGKAEQIVLFNYGCHPTTRGGYTISGDYPAAAARRLCASTDQTRHAMFLQGGAGDNRVPCTSEDGSSFVPGDSDKVIEYGNEVAKAVERILKGKLRRIKPRFAAARATFKLRYSRTKPEVPPEFEREYRKLVRWRLHNESKSAVAMEWTVWRLATNCVLMAIPGEVCHMIGKRARKTSGAEFAFFAGYANGTPCYIPTDRILDEGGYEADRSMVVYGHPYLLDKGIDKAIDNNLQRALADVNVSSV